MGAEPGKRLLKQPAAKLKSAIVMLSPNELCIVIALQIILSKSRIDC